MLHQLAPVGGIGTYVLSLLPKLANLECEHFVVFANGDSRLAPHAHIIPELLTSSISHSTLSELTSILSREIPDVIHLHNAFHPAIMGYCVDNYATVFTAHNYALVCPAQDLYFHRTQSICDLHVSPSCFVNSICKRCLSLRPSHAVATYKIAKWGCTHGTAIPQLIAPCQYTANRFIRAGFSTNSVVVLPYFCPTDPAPSPRALPNTPTVLFAGRVTDYKGYQHFLQLLGALPSSVKGVMIGSASELEQRRIRELVNQLGCQDRFRLRSWASPHEVAEAMQQATVFVFPSLWPETLGIVGLEALSAGVPVVAYDVGGVEEWLINGETGFRVTVKDLDALISCTSELLNRPELNHLFGQNGINLIKSKFDPNTHLSQLLNVYRTASQKFEKGR